MKSTLLSIVLVLVLSASNTKQEPDSELGNTFAVAMLNELSRANPSKNFVFSPYSLRNCFALAYPGAAETTKSEMQSIFKFQDSPEEQLKQYKISNQENTGLAKSKVYIASSMWIKDKYPLKSSYTNLIKENTNALFPLSSAKPVNDWVAKETNNSIKELVTPQELTNMEVLLLNCMSLEAEWKFPFREEITTYNDFFVDEKTKLSVPTMFGTINSSYYDDSLHSIFQLPFQDELAMTIIVPKTSNYTFTLDDKMQLRIKGYRDIYGDKDIWTETDPFDLFLPKFKIASSHGMIPILKNMGMQKPFSKTSANFSNMNPILYIGLVKQNAVIQVDEYGTKASASSAVGFQERGIPKQFSVNKPFYYLIHNTKSGDILFAGRVVNPLLK